MMLPAAEPRSSELLAKNKPARITLLQHTRDVMVTVLAIHDSLPPGSRDGRDMLKPTLVAAIFHDLGKAHPDFQKLLRDEENHWSLRRHEIISAGLLAGAIYSTGTRCLDDLLPREAWLATWLAIMLHHKGLYPGPGEKDRSRLQQTHVDRIPFTRGNRHSLQGDLRPCLTQHVALQEIVTTCLNAMLGVWPAPSLSIPAAIGDDFSLDRLFETILHIDREPVAEDEMMAGAAYWQGLVTEGQQAKRVPRFEDRLWLARVLSLLKTADHMASGGILPVPIPRLAEFPMRPNLRAFQILAGNQRASAILKAPTGCGKTDAALAFARANQAKNGRLIYILPFQASLNAMFKRLVQFTTRPDAVDNDLVVGISHAKNLEFLTMFFESAEFGRGQEPPYDARSLKSLAREVYYPVKVSTAHQVLRFLLYGKGWDSLLLELADAVMIFDEIHAYDPRVLGFMIGLMKILRERFNVRFLIMTATIPTFIITLLQEHVFHDAPAPLLSLNPSESTDRAIIERHRHHVVLHDTCILDHVSSPGSLVVIKDRYQHGFTQLFVCNTVGTAQRVYELIKNDPSFDRDHVLLFHSRFNARDRNSKEERVIPGKRDLPATRILVATQVVEVSLDISYDFGYFEAAPIDAMIQRMGRVNRQGESRVDVTTLPNVHVFTKREYDGLIYDKDVVSRSIEHLRRLANHPLLEAEWDAVVDAVYPGFSTSEQAEFDHALRYQGIDGFADRFEAGLQQEWIAEIIEDVDHLIEILPAVCMAEYCALIGSKEYVKARMLLVNCDIRVLRPAWHGQGIAFNQGLHVFVLDHPAWAYDRENGLHRVGPVSSGMLTSPPDAA